MGKFQLLKVIFSSDHFPCDVLNMLLGFGSSGHVGLTWATHETCVMDNLNVCISGYLKTYFAGYIAPFFY